MVTEELLRIVPSIRQRRQSLSPERPQFILICSSPRRDSGEDPRNGTSYRRKKQRTTFGRDALERQDAQSNRDEVAGNFGGSLGR